MLPGPRRIRLRADYRSVMRAGSRAASGTMVVHGLVTGSDRPARAGFVVGRSVGPAVVRNRVVRRLRHLMAANLNGLPAGTDLVVRALPPSAEATSAELRHDMSSGIRRVLSRLGHDAGTRPTVSR